MGRLLDAAEKRALDVECARHPVPARPAARLAAMAPTGDKPLPGPMGRNTPRCSFCHGVVEVTPDGRFAPHVHPDTGRACPISGTDVAATKLWRPLVPSAWTAPGGARFGLVMHDPSDGAFCFHLFDGRWFQGSTTLPTLEADVVRGEGEDTDPQLETSFDLDIRPGTQSGTEQVLRGRGVPGLRGGRGDLVVNVVVETPTRLDPRQEELLRELAAIRGEEAPTGQVRAAHKGMFGRLRDAFNAH